jgi:tetraacyldisaccharide 4'-kinase
MNLPFVLRILLWPFSVLYGGVARLRAALYAAGWLKQKRLRGKVVSVGNLTVGGTGKTPMVMLLAERFLGQGKCVAILSRGYRGEGGTSDEIELMRARLGDRVVFGVGKDRFAEGRRIEERKTIDVFLLDDGFQHLQLARDVDIVMLDGARQLEDEWLLPAGRLREPISASRRADILVVTRKAKAPQVIADDLRGAPIFYAETRILGFQHLGEGKKLQSAGELGPGPFFAFSGIGNPQAFLEDLVHWQVPVAGKKSFRDHHRYSTSDLTALKEEALRAGAIALITTEKDAFNIADSKATALPIYTAVIDMAMPRQNEFDAALAGKLGASPNGGDGAAA